MIVGIRSDIQAINDILVNGRMYSFPKELLDKPIVPSINPNHFNRKLLKFFARLWIEEAEEQDPKALKEFEKTVGDIKFDSGTPLYAEVENYASNEGYLIYDTFWPFGTIENIRKFIFREVFGRGFGVHQDSIFPLGLLVTEFENLYFTAAIDASIVTPYEDSDAVDLTDWEYRQKGEEYRNSQLYERNQLLRKLARTANAEFGLPSRFSRHELHWIEFCFSNTDSSTYQIDSFEVLIPPSNIFQTSAIAIQNGMTILPELLPNREHQKISNRVPTIERRESDDRDRWIYDLAMSGAPYKLIQLKLDSEAPIRGWSPISTDNGIRNRAFEYARRFGLAPPLPRQERS